jgi:hypothetical protein
MAAAGGAAALEGRDRELDAVRTRLDAACNGTGGFVLFTGPAGIGKSTLLRASADIALTRGFAVHRARGWEGPGVPAFWSWTQIVRSLVDCGTDLGALPGGATVTAITTPDAGEPISTPFVLADALARIVAATAARAPQVLVFDDLHVADPSSLDALRFVIGALAEARVLVLAASRPISPADGADDALARLEYLGEPVALGGLERESLARVLDARGLSFDAATVAAIHDATTGNPFFALELARLVTERGSLDLHALPRSVRTVVLEHVALAGPEALPILRAAAVQGRHVELDVLAAVHGESRLSVDDALAVAERVGLVERRETEIRFAHSLIVEVLLDALPNADQGALHLATADAIARLHGPRQRAEQVASHVFEAVGLVDDDRIVDAGRAAAGHARRRSAPADEARHLQRTVEALRATGRPDPRTIVDLLIEQCDALQRAGRVDDGIAVAVEAADLARDLQDWTRFARAAIVAPPDLEGVEVEELVRPEQLGLREEALVRVPRDDPTLVARLMATLAMSLYWAQLMGERSSGHLATAARRDQLTAEALQLARATGDDETIAACLAARLQALWGPDGFAERETQADELIARAEARGDVVLAMRGRVWRVVELLETGRVVEADHEIDDFARHAEVLRHPYFRWTAARWRATRSIMRGQLEDAEARAAAALELGGPAVGEAVAFTFYGTTLGLIRYLQGRMRELEPVLRDMAALHPHIPAWRCGLAAAAAETGDLDAANEQLEWLAADGFRALPRDLYWLGGLAVLAPAILATGNSRVARVVYELLVPFAGRTVLQGNGYSVYGPASRVLGMCAAATGDLATAARHLADAVAERTSQHDPFCALSRYELGRVLLALGEASKGRAALVEAGREFRAIGLDTFAARADDPLPIAAGSSARGVFRLEGDHWVLRRPGAEPVLVPDRRGVSMLHALVHLGEVSALDLAGSAERDGVDGAVMRRALGVQTETPVVDDAALASYRARLHALDADAQAADAAGDAAWSRRIHAERDALVRELGRVTERSGRARRASGPAERARVNVTKHLRRAIADIAARDPDLGAHFERAVSTGLVCAYRPLPDDVIEWTG